MQTYILDIETKPQKSLEEMYYNGITAPKNLKDPEKIEKAIEKKKQEARKQMSVDTDYADIFCVGIKAIDKEARLVKFKNLEQLFKEDEFKLITFNGKKFDIPLLIKQGIKQELDLPYKSLKRMCDRFSERHIDLMEVIGDFAKYKSLDEYLQIYLDVKKKEIDFDNCTDAELEEHCLEDLVNTEKLYKKFKPLC